MSTGKYEEIKEWVREYYPARYSFIDPAHQYVPLLLKALEMACRSFKYHSDCTNEGSRRYIIEPNYWLEEAAKKLKK